MALTLNRRSLSLLQNYITNSQGFLQKKMCQKVFNVKSGRGLLVSKHSPTT